MTDRLKVTESGGARRRFENAVCAACGCLCDDLRIAYDGDAVRELERVCDAGERWIRRERSLDARASIAGEAAGIDRAVDRAATILSRAHAPAVLAGPALSLEAAREAVRLASAIDAVYLPLRSGDAALERAGLDAPELAATLGEVRSRADLLVFWGADPLRTHPRLLERLGLDERRPAARRPRIVLVAGTDRIAENRTLPRAGRVVQVAPGGRRAHLDVLQLLRLELRDEGTPAGLEGRSPRLDAASALAGELRATRRAHVFLGSTLATDPLFRDALGALAASVHPLPRVTVSGLARGGNDRGLLEAETWITGGAGPSMPAAARHPLDERRRFLAGAVGGVGDIPRDGIDVAVEAGLEVPGAEGAYRRPTPSSAACRIELGTGATPGADVSFVVPGLDPRLRAAVVRTDGIHLTLSGRSRAQAGPDPGAVVLSQLRARLRTLDEEGR